MDRKIFEEKLQYSYQQCFFKFVPNILLGFAIDPAKNPKWQSWAAE
jgi:hypothetical protein